MSNILENLRAAFNGYEIAPKNIQLCRAHAEIERLQALLLQIISVCDGNAPAPCNKAMALAFVRSVAAEGAAPTPESSTVDE